MAKEVGEDSYAVGRWVIQPGGQVRLEIARVWPDLGFDVVFASTGLGGKYKAGTVFWLRLELTGEVVRAKAWLDGKVEPEWQLSVTDIEPPAFLAPLAVSAEDPLHRRVGFGSYGGSGLSNAPQMSADDFVATDPALLPTTAPCAGGSAQFNDLSVGGHVFRVRATSASNQVMAIYPWTIVPTPPTIQLTTMPPPITRSGSATFSWQTTGVIDSTTCTLDGTSGSCSSPVTSTNLALGDHSFTVEVANQGGTASASYSWTIDNDFIPIGLSTVRPESALAIFYDETSGAILDAKFFCEEDTVVADQLDGWSTGCNGEAHVQVAPTTGIVIALSALPACSGEQSLACVSAEGFTTVDDLCKQGDGLIVQCLYGTGGGPGQSVRSGLHFIRGYDALAPATGVPILRSAALHAAGCTAGTSNGYFTATTGSCTALLAANFDFGLALPSNAEVRYTVTHGSASATHSTCDFGSSCGLSYSGSWFAPITVDAGEARHAIALRVRLRNTFVPGVPACSNAVFSNNCAFYYTASAVTTLPPTDAAVFTAPVQRIFTGNAERSGVVKTLSLIGNTSCAGGLVVDSEAASQPLGSEHCFVVNMGLQKGSSDSQDDPPIGFGLIAGGAVPLDCDPALPSFASEVTSGCGVRYAANTFDSSPLCPSSVDFFTIPKAPPFESWPPFQCALVQASVSSGQALAAFNERMFGTTSSPTCPSDSTEFVAGRNYWSDENNGDDTWAFPNLSPEDPRVVRVAVLSASGFSGSGNEVSPITSIQRFYITGWGSFGTSLTVRDPCPGNTPPPDLPKQQGFYFWGHPIS